MSNKITKVSPGFFAFYDHFETGGVHQPKPYLCPAKKWTIGSGTTWYFDTKKRVAKDDPPITREEAKRLALGAVNSSFAPLTDSLCRDDLNQNQFDAVTDFIANTGGFYKDSKGKVHPYRLFELINAKVSQESLVKYWKTCAITADGKKSNGLIRRRAAEAELFFKPV